MPNTREKLMRLLCTANSKATEAEAFEDATYADQLGIQADHLIANGVTVQEWIPVTERLPEKNVLVLCIGARGGMFLGTSPTLFSDGTAYFCVPNARSCRYATYWMPLPEAPKGE